MLYLGPIHLNLNILATMTLIGILLGFIGGAGTALVMAALATFFRIPIHQALGTSLAAASFTTLAGTYSPLREGNVDARLGFPVGLSGILGAYLGGALAIHTRPRLLKTLAGLALLLAAALIYRQTRGQDLVQTPNPGRKLDPRSRFFIACGVGLGTGLIAGFLAMGGMVFIQLALLGLLNASLRTAVGTGMLTMFFTSLSGATRFLQEGLIDLNLFLSVVTGTSIGSYLGAKLTGRVPHFVLRAVVVATPIWAATMLLFF
ncbi:MAG: sulfite exporter TauE/SafE family protein [candidate division NC10 bacterium]|nr:sulfite exporter TauE/SafE family protein [candidate division NC10 bacterium]